MGDLFSNGKFILGFIFLVCRMCLAQKTPALFVFGDSLLDPGNNNYITTNAPRANFPPNGIDFGKPTGRFTNNRTIVDLVGENLGFKHLTPPYLAPTTTEAVILRGVSYASGGGGILNETGQVLGGHINFDAQLDDFANTRQQIISRIGLPAAEKLLRRALFWVQMGSNDFVANYLVLVNVVGKVLLPPDIFIGILIARYRLQLTRAYNLGARRILVVNIGPIGCEPSKRESNSTADPNECIEFPNQLARSFNSMLRPLVAELNKNLPGAKFVYADFYKVNEDIQRNHRSYGFENVNTACCRGGGRYGGLVACGPQTLTVCKDRSKYVFWDLNHPSHAVNVIVAERFLHGNASYISPRNIEQLLQSP